MRYIKYIFLIIITFSIGYITYKYFTYNKVFNSNLENLSNDLTVPVLNYASQFEGEDLTNSENFKKMVGWIKKNYNVLEEHEELLKCGYEIKYDIKSNFYLFSLYAEDEKTSNKNISINGIDEEGLYSVKKPSFIDYLFNNSDYDIILFGYKKPNNEPN